MVAPERNHIEKYILLQRHIEEWCKDPQWMESLKLDAWLSSKLRLDLLLVSEQLSFKKTTVEDIDRLLTQLRQKSILALERALSEKSAVSRWRAMRESYGYYALGECITEASVFSDSVFGELKSAMGKSYLEELAEFDQHNPSTLTHISSLDELDKDAYLHRQDLRNTVF